jgi:hypothetical protein
VKSCTKLTIYIIFHQSSPTVNVGFKCTSVTVITLEGGCILFLLAIVGLMKRLFLLPIKSLKDGLLSGSKCGLGTSLRNACLENL